MDLIKSLKKDVKTHSPEILAGLAVTGVLSSVYLAAKAGYESAGVIALYENITGGPPESRKERYLERAKLVWKSYVPTALSVSTTIGCIVFANRIGFRKTIAAQAALAVSQRAYSDYRDKIIEEYGERKDQSIRDKIAEERVQRTAPAENVLMVGPGNVLCCELFTGRYFSSDIESLRKAQNELNAQLLSQDYQTLDDFYYLIGLPQTSTSGQLGWKSSKLMELSFTSALTEDGRPCLAFEYNYTETL